MQFAPYLCAIALVSTAGWLSLDAAGIAALQDDDIERLRANGDDLAGMEASHIRFSENGFDWHLVRFTNEQRPSGPLWVVPHDDENAAFHGMIAAVRRHGGIGIVVDTGIASTRRQPGYGVCGVRPGTASGCDPNRNFDGRSPLFTRTILDQLPEGQPVIALHTNGAGFSGDGKGGRGSITMLDARFYARGEIRVRADGYFGNRGVAGLDDPDVYAIMPYRSGKAVPAADAGCRSALNAAGVNVWHEGVERSDGSLSNYIALNRPDIAYVNLEAKREANLAPGAEAQRLMIDAYLNGCAALWNKPASAPVAGR
jgi:hypothetical protein